MAGLSRLGAAARAACLLLVAAPAARAQTPNVTPEVMLLVDTSQSMEWRVDRNEGPQCVAAPTSWPAAHPGTDALERSRMMTVQEVLAGSFGHQPWCVVDDRSQHALGLGVRFGAQTSIPHHRAVCCAALDDGGCASWRPCGNDHGRTDAAADDATPLGVGAAFGTEGLVYRYRRHLRFGLMSFDGAPHAGADALGQYSFPPGGDGVSVPAEVAGAVGAGTLRGIASADGVTPDARGVLEPNLGVRGPEAPLGRLVPAHRGVVGDPARALAEDAGSAEAHNAMVMDEIRRLVPLGFTPIAPMLHDALRWYDATEAAGAWNDPAAQCRRRVAVLLTDGRATDYYGGQPCGADGRCDDGGTCVSRGGQQVCAYPEGYPYATSETYAAELFARGIPLFVVGLSLADDDAAQARRIAAAGSPGLGRDGGPGFFLAADREALRDALGRIAQAALVGFRSRTPPLVAAPAPGDGLGDVVQWRLNAFTEVAGVADPHAYGHIELRHLACDAEDPDAVELVVRATVEVAEVFDQGPGGHRRRLLTRAPDGTRTLAVLGSDAPMFDDDGARPASRDLALQLTGAGDDVDLRRVGRQLDGRFGERGLPGGDVDGPVGPRQLGAILEGGPVAIPPPALGIEDPAWATFEAEHRLRPTLVATGGGDGMVHVFRAADGHEVFGFVPRAAWPRLLDAAAAQAEPLVDGPLDAGEVVACRHVAGGPRGCAPGVEELRFRTLLVGGVGRGGRNLFGLDITALALLAARDRDGEPLRFAAEPDGLGAQGPAAWDVTEAEVPKLGLAVSRPVLTHVRVGDEVRAAVVAGCGEDPARAGADPDAVGRCVLVLDALSGEVLRVFEGVAMDRAMVGWPVAWPARSVAPAERAWIGDEAGRVWRLDLREPDPARWTATVAWPPADPLEAEGYATGRPVVGRPSVSLRDDGRVVVAFATGGPEQALDATDRAHVVSFTEGVEPDAFGEPAFAVRANWVLPLRAGEVATGAPVVRDQVAWFTTVQPREDACASATGRLYGVHYVATGDAFALGDRQARVKPMLPYFQADGAPGPAALAVTLPPGRVAYGAAVVTPPGCGDEAPTTEVVLDLADDARGPVGAPDAGQMQAELVEMGLLRSAPLDGHLHTGRRGTELSLCLDCDPQGRPLLRDALLGPFPSVVGSWGQAFGD